MNKKLLQLAANFVYDEYDGNGILLNDFIAEKVEKITLLLQKTDEWVFESLVEPSSKYFESLTEMLEKIISDKNHMTHLICNHNFDGFYIELTELGKSFRSPLKHDLINTFEQVLKRENKKEKGVIFENFCIAFFKDLGMEPEKTASSNDKGIDIVASYKTNINNVFSKYIFRENIYLLGQCKMYKEKIDTPVIRKLVGDSLFIRFSDLEYYKIKHNAVHLLVISYSGFTEPALRFAEKNMVQTLDFGQLCTLVLNHSSGDDLICLRYAKMINYRMNKVP